MLLIGAARDLCLRTFYVAEGVLFMSAQLSIGRSVTAKFVFIILFIICVCCQRLPKGLGIAVTVEAT